MITVKATREGLIGGKTASGYLVEEHVPYVALPSEHVLRRCVRIVRYSPNGTLLAACVAIVLDVGPHFTDDDAYVLDGQRPRAESQPGGNGAGIDLGQYVWHRLGMTGNGAVAWEFLD
jgi:hypothetical protein